ncbi:MAG: phage minor head protein [Pseudomonadota bacterium]
MPIPSYTTVAKPVAPDAAIAFWQQRAKLTYGEAKALGDGARHRAFYVAGLAQHDLVRLVSDGIEEALKSGETLADFKKRIQKAIKSQGWHSHRVENIFRTNMQTAYAAGRYAKMQAVKKSRPYWQYISVEDKRRRPSHAVLHGLVYPADHEFWDANYPPNGFRCRCTVRTLSKRQAEKEGLSVKRAMPKATMWTDPKTGMEYHVAFPGADKGFRNNVGKDWLAGLDLEQYPDLHKKAYDEVRGEANKRPKTVNNFNELEQELKLRCSSFASNNGITSVKVTTDSYFMATYCDGRFLLSNRTFKLGNGKNFNAAQELKNAWNKLASGEKLTWNEEYSLESFWHEVVHNTQTRGSMSRGSSKLCMMEVVTQWTARRSYHEMIESLGGKAIHQADIIKNGLGYGSYIKHFDRLLEVLSVDDRDLFPRLQNVIQQQKTPEYLGAVEQILVDFSGKKKSAIKRSLANIGKSVDFEEILKDTGLIA